MGTNTNQIATRRDARKLGYSGTDTSQTEITAGRCATYAWVNATPPSNTITVPNITVCSLTTPETKLFSSGSAGIPASQLLLFIPLGYSSVPSTIVGHNVNGKITSLSVNFSASCTGTNGQIRCDFVYYGAQTTGVNLFQGQSSCTAGSLYYGNSGAPMQAYNSVSMINDLTNSYYVTFTNNYSTLVSGSFYLGSSSTISIPTAITNRPYICCGVLIIISGDITGITSGSLSFSRSGDLVSLEDQKLVKYSALAQPYVYIMFYVTESVLFGTAHNGIYFYFIPYSGGTEVLKGSYDYGGAIQESHSHSVRLNGLTPTEAAAYGSYQAGTQNSGYGYFRIETGYGDGNQQTYYRMDTRSSNGSWQSQGSTTSTTHTYSDFNYYFRTISVVRIHVGNNPPS